MPEQSLTEQGNARVVPVRQRIIVIAGPTASGKTAMATALARRLHCPIISADSRQVYRGLDLGTGKDMHLYASTGPYSAIKTHMIDVAEPSEVYSLFRYQQDAYAVLSGWHEQAGGVHPIILCGGSGLYIEALLRKYAMANVPEDKALRNQLAERSSEALIGELQTLDPEWASRTDLSSKKRVIRALEVAYARQRGPVALSQAPAFDFDVLLFVVGYDAEQLKNQIATRLKERLHAGMIEEVQALLAKGISLSRLKQLGLEYREVGEYLAGERDFESMVARLQSSIEDFAKRQATWFRGMPKRGLATLEIPMDQPSRLPFLLDTLEKHWPDLGPRFFSPPEVKKRFAMAALCDTQGRVLMVRRSPHLSFAPGLWGLPGGHFQPGESPDQAIRRELKEELGAVEASAVSADVGSSGRISLEPGLFPVRDTLYGGVFEVYLYRGHWLGGEIVLNEEHSEYAWVSAREYAGYEVVPGVDEDLAYLQIWSVHHLNPKRLPAHLLG